MKNIKIKIRFLICTTVGFLNSVLAGIQLEIHPGSSFADVLVYCRQDARRQPCFSPFTVLQQVFECVITQVLRSESQHHFCRATH